MGRLLLTPKWLGLTIAALLAIAVCTVAAGWQWDRSQQTQEAEAARVAGEVPVQSLLSADMGGVPIEALGRRVTAEGVFVPGAQSLIRSRQSDDGQAGFWVVQGVELADGQQVAVVSGWSATDQVREPSGEVTVTGRLQPDENFYPNAEIRRDDPLVTVTRPGLRSQWALDAGSVDGGVAGGVTGGVDGGVDGRDQSRADPDLLPGFIAATSISPAVPGISPVRPLIGSDPQPGFPLRNILYSAQWLVFVGFVVLMWVRWFREDLAEARGPVGGSGAESGSRVSLDA